MVVTIIVMLSFFMIGIFADVIRASVKSITFDFTK